MNAVTFGLMIPLGRRWKSYSTESTTTVCPALLPPWGKKSINSSWCGQMKTKYRQGINSFHLQLCGFYFLLLTEDLHEIFLTQGICSTWFVKLDNFHMNINCHIDFLMVSWFIEVRMLWSTMFLEVIGQINKHSRLQTFLKAFNSFICFLLHLGKVSIKSQTATLANPKTIKLGMWSR